MESFSRLSQELEKQMSQLTQVYLSESIKKFSRNHSSDGIAHVRSQFYLATNNIIY